MAIESVITRKRDKVIEIVFFAAFTVIALLNIHLTRVSRDTLKDYQQDSDLIVLSARRFESLLDLNRWIRYLEY